MNADLLIMRIDALLPQTQCGQCGYAGCQPYAQALAHEQADVNQCPPGGDDGIRALAALLGRPYRPLNPLHGVHKPKALAVIDEAACIGCTLCIQACPVDAILGANRLMHTVIAGECTGCELCLQPCPVDCIRLQPVADATRLSAVALQQAADLARSRYQARQRRLERKRQQRTKVVGETKVVGSADTPLTNAGQASSSAVTPGDTPAGSPAADNSALKKAALAAAMAKARSRA